jgi:hypothetical protein
MHPIILLINVIRGNISLFQFRPLYGTPERRLHSSRLTEIAQMTGYKTLRAFITGHTLPPFLTLMYALYLCISALPLTRPEWL